MEVDEPEPPVLSIPPPPPPPKDSIAVSHLSRLGTLALEWQCYEQHTSCIILVSVWGKLLHKPFNSVGGKQASVTWWLGGETDSLTCIPLGPDFFLKQPFHSLEWQETWMDTFWKSSKTVHGKLLKLIIKKGRKRVQSTPYNSNLQGKLKISEFKQMRWSRNEIIMQ